MSDVSNPFTVTISSRPKLVTDCLVTCAASGSNAASTIAAQSLFTLDDNEWSNHAHHDANSSLIQWMGKPANAGTAWKSQTYNILTDTWTTIESSMWNNDGHVYGNFSMDWATGDLFQSKSTAGSDLHPKRIGWYQRAINTWNYAPVNQDIYSGALEAHMNGVGWHPNLYGLGDGGLIVDDTERTMFWRKSTDAVDQIAHTSAAYGNIYAPMVWWPANNCVVFGGGQPSGVTPTLAMVQGNNGAQPIVTPLAMCPFTEVGGDTREGSYANGLGQLIVHPGNPNKLLAVGTTNANYYTATLSGTTLTWSANLGPHPLSTSTATSGAAAISRVLVSLRGGLGCVLGLGVNGNGGFYAQVWRPPT